MLTLCPRCRTPYDRRIAAGHALPFGSDVVCTTCSGGRVVDTRGPKGLVLTTTLPVDRTLRPRTLLAAS